MRRKLMRLFTGTVYAAGGLLIAAGAVMLLAPEPMYRPGPLLVGGVLVLVAGKVLEWLEGPGDGAES